MARVTGNFSDMKQKSRAVDLIEECARGGTRQRVEGMRGT